MTRRVGARVGALVWLLPAIALAAGKDIDQSRAEPELVLQTGHSLPVTAVALDAGGNRLATGSRDGSAILWETATGHKLREIKAEPLGVTAVALSADGRRLLTGGAGTAKLWDAETGALIRKLGLPGEFLHSVLFTPDGRSALTAGDDGAAKLWDLATGRRTKVFSGAPSRIESLALSRDGARLAFAAGGPDIWVFDANSGLIIQQFTGGGPWSAVAFTPDGRSVLSGGADSLTVWDLASGKDTLSIKGAAGRAVVPVGGRFFISCGGGNTARVWKAGSGEPARSLIGHLDAVAAAAVSTDGKWVVTGSDDHTARLWNAATGEAARTFGGSTLPVLYAAISARGDRLVTVDAQKAALWDLSSGRPIGRSTGDWETASRFSVSSDGRYLASLRDRELVDLRDLEQGKDLGSFQWNLIKARALGLDPAGRFLVTSRDESLQAWTVPDAREKPILGGHGERAGWLAVAQDGKRLVTRSGDGAVLIWDLESGRRVARFKLGANALPDVVLSRDGRFLAAGAGSTYKENGAARYSLSVRSLSDGEELKSWEPAQAIEPLAFGSSGDSLLVSSADGVWEWDISTGRKKDSFSLGEQTLMDWPEAVDPGWRFLLARRDEALSFVSLADGKELATLRLFDKGWLAQAPDGRLDASPGAARWTVGSKSYPLEQFAGARLSRGLLGRLLRP